MTSDRSARMTAGDDSADALAAAAKRAYAQSLEHLSPRVNAQLALRRRDALAPTRRDRRPRWWPALAAGSVAAMALAIGLRLQPPPQPTPADTAEDLAAIIAGMDTPDPRGANSGTGRNADPHANTGSNDTAGLDSLDEYPLDESPDLYLWLASDEADVLTEETP